jgi:hypothetical protein
MTSFGSRCRVVVTPADASLDPQLLTRRASGTSAAEPVHADCSWEGEDHMQHFNESPRTIAPVRPLAVPRPAGVRQGRSGGHRLGLRHRRDDDDGGDRRGRPAARPAATRTATPTASCPAGQVDCGGACFDVSSDPDHCGSCDNTCGFGESCASGNCVGQCPLGSTAVRRPVRQHRLGPQQLRRLRRAVRRRPGVRRRPVPRRACPIGTIQCGQDCADAASDPDHCGGCDQQCNGAEVCASGNCVCTGGTVQCDGQCVDVQSDPNNCGDCGNDCDGGACEAGHVHGRRDVRARPGPAGRPVPGRSAPAAATAACAPSTAPATARATATTSCARPTSPASCAATVRTPATAARSSARPTNACAVQCVGGQDACGDQTSTAARARAASSVGRGVRAAWWWTADEGPCAAQCEGGPAPNLDCGPSCRCNEC